MLYTVRRAATCLALPVLVCAVPAAAQDAPGGAGGERDSVLAYELEPIAVEGRATDLSGVARSASEGATGRADLALRPVAREGELLETVPGMILTQHSGDGKSNQMFVRGFNLDHGTDFRTVVEGMPVNLPTHGHGHGYTDVNFLTPELVERIDFRLGVYYPEIGNFGSAGGADVRLVRSLPRSFARTEAGEFGLIRTVAAGSTELGGGELLAGGEFKGYDGPWSVEQGLEKTSGMLRWTRRSSTDEISLLVLGYANDWNASDQVPRRAVESGAIGRFGQIDETLGGETKRFSLSGSWLRRGDEWSHQLDVFAIRYELDLWSNFTYFLDDSDDGDQFQQRDRRWTYGARFQGRRSTGGTTWHVGSETRLDAIGEVGLHRTSRRTITSTIRSDRVTEWATGGWIAAETRWNPWLRTILGLRGDLYLFDVTADIPENSGDRSAGLLSPRASVAFGPWNGTEVYLSGGFGFHSNDARGAVISVDPLTRESVDRVDPLVRSRGAEVGLRLTPLENWRTTLVGWTLDLDSELVFVGDAGTTEPSDRSRRVGVTLTNFWRPNPRLALDADVSLTRARFVDVPENSDFVPGAVERVIAAGATWESAAGGPLAAVRVRHLGAYPLTEDNTVRARATTLVNARLGWRFGDIRATITLLNLFDARHADIAYFYVSRLPGEPAGGIEDVHFHPVEPGQVRFGVSWGL